MDTEFSDVSRQCTLSATTYGQCCERYVIGQVIVSVINVVRSCWSICILYTDYNNATLLLRLLTAVLETFILLYSLHHQHNLPYKATI